VEIKNKRPFLVFRGTRSLRTSALITPVLGTQMELLFYATTSYFKLRFKDRFAFKPTMLVEGGDTLLFG